MEGAHGGSWGHGEYHGVMDSPATFGFTSRPGDEPRLEHYVFTVPAQGERIERRVEDITIRVAKAKNRSH